MPGPFRVGITENATAAGWKTKPSWYLVCDQDNAIPPEASGFMAERMGATTETMAGSHAAFVAHPVAVAEFIDRAVKCPIISMETEDWQMAPGTRPSGHRWPGRGLANAQEPEVVDLDVQGAGGAAGCALRA
jgi:hypothetical protein